MIAWNPGPTEYGDFNGHTDALGADVSVEKVPRRQSWSWHVWGSDGRLMWRSDNFYNSADDAKHAAEVWELEKRHEKELGDIHGRSYCSPSCRAQHR